jgi:cell division transport system permease protein
MRDRYRGWLRHHRLSAADSLYRVLEKPLSSVLTWLVLGIAMALPVGLDVALENTARLSAGWESPAQISLFLQEGLSREEAGQLRARIGQWESVSSSSFVSREDALAEFREVSGFADILDGLRENPLPDLILVTPSEGLDSAGAARLRGELELLPGVAQALLDMAWLQRLDSLMELGRRLLLTAGVLLLVGGVLILGNTIRLAIENRREEIVIVKLVGGSDSFVRRPFLYTGLWYGVGGGVIAAALVAAGLWFLREPVASLALLYGSDFQLQGRGVMGALNLVLLGGLLGLAGAWLAVARHLTQIEPQ